MRTTGIPINPILPGCEYREAQDFGLQLRPNAHSIDAVREEIEALLDGDGQYVGDSFEIEYSAGLFFLSENQRPRVIAHASRALIVGESFGDQAAGLKGLPDAGDEAREVAARFDSPVLLLGGEAQLARILNELPNAQVFHFAGRRSNTRQEQPLLLVLRRESCQLGRASEAGPAPASP